MRLAAGFMLILAAVLPGARAAASDDPANGIRNDVVHVTMKDGTRLWVCLSMPYATPAHQKLPALLTLDPYPKSCGDFGRAWYGDYVRAGYVVATAQVRGTGSSAGTYPSREYSEEELGDAESLIAWLAKQPWSTGKVGMFGSSWSGFNALAVALRRPPALKAVVAQAATENIYHEDVHYADGIFRFDDYNVFADLQLLDVPGPARPDDADMLTQRFDQAPWSLIYLRQQRDGEFWRRSLRLDQQDRGLGVPTLMVGAWLDGYRKAVFRALERGRTSVKAIIGPWDHSVNFPGPAADLGAVEVRWWDYWLKGRKNAVLDEPQLIAYMRRPWKLRADVAAIPGEWRAFARWPAADLRMLRLQFTANHRLAAVASENAVHKLDYVPTSGAEAGMGWADLQPDQRPYDAYSLVYDSDPLDAELPVIGTPEVGLKVSAGAPRANWIVRLSDVAPDGSVSLITGGAINATHRTSAVNPEDIIPGKIYDLTVAMHPTGWIFEKGHRIRVAISNAAWPMYWPTPFPMTTTLEIGGPSGSFLRLPIVGPQGDLDAATAAGWVGSRNLSRTEAAAVVGEKEYIWNGPARSELHRDLLTQVARVSKGFTWDERNVEDTTIEFKLSDLDPAHAEFRGTTKMHRKVGVSLYEWRGLTEISSDAATFHYHHERDLLKDGAVIRHRQWREDVKRDFQ